MTYVDTSKKKKEPTAGQAPKMNNPSFAQQSKEPVHTSRTPSWMRETEDEEPAKPTS
jgi:hypothetical protein